MYRFPALFAAIALPWLAATPASSAVIQTVLLGDAPDFDPTDGICDSDPVNDLVVDPDPEDDEVVEVGQCTLRAAIQTANFEAGPDTIRLRATTYPLSLAGSNEDAALTGDLDITSDITIDGQSYQLSLLDGRKLKDRIFDVHPGGSLDLNQTGLLFGKAPKPELDSGAAGEAGHGGCLRSRGDVTLDEAFFFRCSTGTSGGCMSVLDGTAEVSNSVFAACQAKNEGGGLEVGPLGDATLSRVTGGACRAATGGGAATRGMLTLVNTTFTINSAKLGGGVALLGDSTTTIRHGTISDNGKTNLLSETTGGATISSSIVSGAKTDCVGPLTSAGGNLESGTSCGFTGTNDQQSQDPLLLPLGFSGAIPVAPIAEGSPAIDHGVDGVDVCEARDSREAVRVVATATGPAMSDAGAFELGGVNTQGPIISTPDLTATVGAAYSYDAGIGNTGATIEVDRGSCGTYSLDVSPAGMTIDATSGLVSWTPAPGQEGNRSVTIRFEDAVLPDDTQAFVIAVSAAPAP
jgi:CSLREA domain-containing protein